MRVIIEAGHPAYIRQKPAFLQIFLGKPDSFIEQILLNSQSRNHFETPAYIGRIVEKLPGKILQRKAVQKMSIDIKHDIPDQWRHDTAAALVSARPEGLIYHYKNLKKIR